MIVHEHVTVDENTIAVMIVFQDMEKLPPLGVPQKDIPPFIASAGHMVHCAGVFYP